MSAIASDPKLLYDRVRSGTPGEMFLCAEGLHYVRRFEPRERLILLGGGHIATVMGRMGAMLDFEVIAVDDRPEFASKERFPEAAQVICGDFPSAIAALAVREGDYVCVMTRGHQSDAASLRTLLAGETWPGYIGMVGSRRRGAELFALLRDEGYDAERIASIHSPIGLSINAVTPAEIAVSICAEIVEYRRRNYRKHPPVSEEAGSAEHPIVLATHDGALPVLQAMAEDRSHGVLLCVLETSGSTPVASGACMAVDRSGRGIGTIGGGLGEMTAMARAKELIGSGAEEIIRVNMTNDAAAEEGMVCGGTMKVLIVDLTREDH